MNGRVLYLDDEESLVFLASRQLRRLGYEPMGFTEAPEALAAFKTDPASFVLVLTDLSMPGANGLDFAQEILALAPGTRVAILTGHLDPADGPRAKAVGVHAMEQKPLQPEEWGRVIRQLLI
jgi:two-component system cell cycle sensor histidine kinase/response regulator CckA